MTSHLGSIISCILLFYNQIVQAKEMDDSRLIAVSEGDNKNEAV